MIARLLSLASLAAWPMAAQFAFSEVQNSMEIPAAGQFQLGSAAPGDTLDTTFRVRNDGNATAQLNSLQIGGSSFCLTDLPALPATLLPGAYLDFTVRFQPAGAGAFSALLQADGASVFLQASGVAALTIYFDQNGTRTQLNSTSAVDFGAVLRGTQAIGRLIFMNQTAQTLASTVGTVGDAFSLAPGVPRPLALDPQASAEVDVLFAPIRDGAQQGLLQVDQRSFTLRGTAMEPPLPQPILVLDLNQQAPASGMQAQAGVRFDPPPATSGSGRLRIDFQPAIDGAADDPAVMFLSTGGRSIDFSVIEGEAGALFGTAAAVPFQTGTTAGTIVFTAELGDYSETACLVIPPQPVVIQLVQMSQGSDGISVEVSGYDNTHSLAQASFTFLQKNGTALPPGPIQQDVSAAFQSYFASSTLGGNFLLNATFPVTGSAGLIESVQVGLTNAIGQTNWPK